MHSTRDATRRRRRRPCWSAPRAAAQPPGRTRPRRHHPRRVGQDQARRRHHPRLRGLSRSGRPRRPAVIVIHEIFGLTDWEPTVADRLAKEGFVAIVPDLLSSKHGRSPADPDSGRKLIGELEPERITADLDATYAYVNGLPVGAQGSTSGTIGFCWGGGQSFRYATNNPNLRAAVVCYGPPPDTAAMKRIKARRCSASTARTTSGSTHAARGDRGDAVGGEDLHHRGLSRHRPRLPQARAARAPTGRRSSGPGRGSSSSTGPGSASDRGRGPAGCSRCLLAMLRRHSAAGRSPRRRRPPPATHDALSYDITLVTSDTGAHVLGEVQTAWRLRSAGAGGRAARLRPCGWSACWWTASPTPGSRARCTRARARRSWCRTRKAPATR